MHVEFSRRKKLSVKIQTARGRDYTLQMNEVQGKNDSTAGVGADNSPQKESPTDQVRNTSKNYGSNT